jgi:hypothetical protein
MLSAHVAPITRLRAATSPLGDRSWGQIRGFSGRLKAPRGRGAGEEEVAVMQGNRASKRGSYAV